MHKDLLGRVIEVGHPVAYSSPGCGAEIGIVTQILPKTIRINGGSCISTHGVLIIKEQYQASGVPEKLDELIDQYKSSFVFDEPKIPSTPAVKSTYAVMFFYGHGEKFFYVAKLPHHSSSHAAYQGMVKGFTDRGYQDEISYNKVSVSRHRNSKWEWVYQVVSQYRVNYELLLKDIKALGLVDFIDQKIPIEDFLILTKNTTDAPAAGLLNIIRNL